MLIFFFNFEMKCWLLLLKYFSPCIYILIVNFGQHSASHISHVSYYSMINGVFLIKDSCYWRTFFLLKKTNLMLSFGLTSNKRVRNEKHQNREKLSVVALLSRRLGLLSKSKMITSSLPSKNHIEFLLTSSQIICYSLKQNFYCTLERNFYLYKCM